MFLNKNNFKFFLTKFIENTIIYIGGTHMLKEPKKNLSLYFIATLSNDEIFYEDGKLDSWKKLLNYCNVNNLTMKKFEIYDNGKIRLFNQSNVEYYFAIYDVNANLNNNQSTMKRGYGSICLHPRNLKRCYIEWYNCDNKKRIYAEVLRDNQIPKFYEKNIGIVCYSIAPL